MRLPSYLFRNLFGIYYFRVVFPQDVRDILKRKGIKRSLRTRERRTAINISLEFRKITENFFHLIVRNKMSWIETKKFFDDVAEQLFQRYVEKVNQVGFDFVDGDTLEKIMPEASTFLAPDTSGWQHTIHFDRERQQMVNRQEFEAECSVRPQVVEFVEGIVEGGKLPLKKGSDEFKKFCRETLEMLYRLDNRKGQYKNQILHGLVATTVPVADVQELKSPLPKMTIRELIEKYCENKISIEKAWANPRTIKGYRENLGRIADIFDYVTKQKNIAVAAMTKEHAREVRRILSIIPVNLKKKFPDLTFKQIIKKCENGEIAQNDAERLQPSTFNTYANLIGGLFKFAQTEDFIKDNNFNNLRVKRQEKQSRSAFTDEELQKFFNSDLFAKKEIQVKWAWRFWVPVIMLYTGARVEEICQLYLDDILEEKGVLCFDICEKRDAETNEKIKSIKNDQSKRSIPVHPKLKVIGLLEYIQWLRTKGEERLFPTLKNKDQKGQYKQINPPVSKWFNEDDLKQHKTSYIKKCGITDASKVLYCFRHTVETVLINHQDEIEHDKIDAVMGHQTRSTGRVHYGSYDSGTLLRVVSKIDYPQACLPWDVDKNYGKIPFPWK